MSRIIKILPIVVFIALLLSPLCNQNYTDLQDGLVNTKPNVSVGKPERIGTQQAASWWNTTYYYRVPITISGTNGIARKFEPITVQLSFPSGHAKNNSIRVINPDESQVPYQLSNVEMYSGTDFYKSVTLTFPVNASSDGVVYYVYYTSVEVEEPTFANQLQATFDGNILTVSNGLYDAKISKDDGFEELEMNGYDYLMPGSFAPTGGCGYMHVVEYVYVVSGDNIYITAWHDKTYFRILNTTDYVLASGVLNSGELYTWEDYPNTELLKIEANNTITFQIYDGTDDTWSFTGSLLYAWIRNRLYIAAFDRPAKIVIDDLTDNDDDRMISLAPGETWEYTAFDSDVALIKANATIYILGGSIEGLNPGSTWSGPETFSPAYGINQTFYTVFAAPTNGLDGYIGIMSLQDNTNVQVINKSTGVVAWSGVLDLLDVKVVDTNGSWYDIKADKPIVVYTGMHQDDEDSAVSDFHVGGIEILSNSKKYYVLNPDDPNLASSTKTLKIHYVTLRQNTIVKIQTKAGVTTEIYSSAFTDDEFTLAPGEGAIIQSNHPLAVRLYSWSLQTSQEETLIVMERRPAIAKIVELERGPVFAKYKLYWNLTDHRLNATDIVTFYYNYPIIEYYRDIWWGASFTEYSLEPIILHFEVVKDTVTFYVNTLIEDGATRPIQYYARANNYVAAWDSADYVGMGLIVDSVNVEGDISFTPEFAFYEVAGGFSFASGRLDFSLNIYSLTTFNGQQYRVKINGSLIAGDNFASTSEIHNLYQSLQYPLSATVGDEEVSLRLDVIVNDLDGNPVVGANVTLYLPSGGKLGSGISNSTGEVFFDQIPEFGDYTLETYYITQYNNIKVEDSRIVTFSDSDVGTIKIVTVTLSLANLTITITNLKGEPIPNDAVVSLRNASNPSQIIAEATTNSNGQVRFEYLPGITYNITSRYLPGSPSGTYTFIHNSSYTLDSSDSLTFAQQINTISVRVIDYDGNPVENVKVTRENQDYTDTYQTMLYTNATGWVTFTNVRTGNLKIKAEITNAYNQQIDNQTYVYLSNNASATVTLRLPMANIVVKVYDSNHHEDIEGALVFINKTSDKSLVASASTDQSGYAVFSGIACNIEYNISATKNGQWDYTIKTLTQSYSVQLNISLTWLGPDTVLILHNSTVISAVWDDNVTIVVGFVNRTDGADDVPLAQNEVNYVNYTIKLGSQVVNTGSLNYLSNGNWTVTLDTGDLKLNATNYYVIVIEGDAATNATSGASFTDPTSITLTLIIDFADTSVTPTYPEVSVEWGFNVTLRFNFVDEHGIYITDAVTSSEIRVDGSVLHVYGSLTNLGNGTYVFSGNSSDVNSLNLPAGNYTLVLFFGKYNYVNQTVYIPFQVKNKNTTIDATPITISLNWSDSFVLYVNYSSYGIELDGAIVWARWDTGVEINYTSYSNGLYIFDVNTSLVNTGVHTLTIYAELMNYTKQSFDITINVQEVPTSAVPLSSIQFAINWSEAITVEIEYVDVNHSLPIEGATVTVTNWNSSAFTVTYDNNRYYITFLSEYMSPGNYLVTLNFNKQNYEAASITVNITILTPLKISVKGGNVIFIYWLDRFTINATVVNQYNGTVVENVTLLYSQTELLLVDEDMLFDNDTKEFYITYNSTVFGSDGTYLFTLKAVKKGCVSVPVDVYIVIQKRPTTASYPSPTIRTVYYADVVNITISWTDDISGHPVSSPDSIRATISIGELVLYSNISTIYEISPGNYSILIHTSDLSMVAGKTYIVTIELQKTGFKLEGLISYTIFVQETPTNITVLTKESEYWGNNITITVKYEDIIHDFYITNGNVTLTIAGVEFKLNLTDNEFKLTLNTSQFTVGTYLVRVSASAPNYASSERTIQLQILNRTTSLTVETTPESRIIVQESIDHIRISVKYIDELKHLPIRNATVTLTIAGGATYTFKEYPNGTYILFLDMANFTTPGNYTLVISAKKDNFEFKTESLTIIIEEPYVEVFGRKIPTRSIINVGGGATVAIGLMGLALYGYRIYKIPWIIRATDKAIKALIKGKPVDFSKFPDLNDLLDEVVAPMFEVVKRKIPTKREE